MSPVLVANSNGFAAPLTFRSYQKWSARCMKDTKDSKARDSICSKGKTWEVGWVRWPFLVPQFSTKPLGLESNKCFSVRLTTFDNVSFKQVSNVPNAGTMACALQSFCKSLCFAMGKDLPTRAIHARRHPETRLGGLADSAFWNCTIYKGSGWIIVNYVRHVTANWCLICFIISYVFLHVYSVIIWCTWIPILKHYSCPEQWDWRIWSPSAIEIAVFYGHDMLSQGVWWLMSRSMINVNVIIIRTSPQYDPTWHTKVCVFGVKRHVSSRCSMNCGLLKGIRRCFMLVQWNQSSSTATYCDIITWTCYAYEQLEGVTWVTWCGAHMALQDSVDAASEMADTTVTGSCIWSSDNIFNETSEVCKVM